MPRMGIFTRIQLEIKITQWRHRGIIKRHANQNIRQSEY